MSVDDSAHIRRRTVVVVSLHLVALLRLGSFVSRVAAFRFRAFLGPRFLDIEVKRIETSMAAIMIVAARSIGVINF